MMRRFLCVLAALPLFAHGDLHEQIARVTALIAKDADNPALYLRRGELYRLHEDFAAAERDLDRAAALPEVYLYRGRLEADRERWPAALASLLRAPESEASLALRARVYDKLGRPEDAARDWRGAIAKTAAEPKVEYYLGLANSLEAARRQPEAIQTIDEGIRVLGWLATLEQWAVESEARARHWTPALTRLNRLLAASARKEAWLVRKAELEQQAGRPAAARQSAEAAQQAFQSLPEHLRRTKAMMDLGQRIAALLPHAP